MFNDFKNAVTAQFDKMKGRGLFRVSTPLDLLWSIYINAFPSGTDPLYKNRTEHDCSYCRHFIRSVGDVVAIIDGKLVSIWDVEVGGFYQTVADRMAGTVKQFPVENVFLTPEAHVGVDKNYSPATDGVITWEHFFLKLPSACVASKADIPTKLGEFRSTKDVLLRSLKEISLDSVDQVLELIAQNSLYRGEENKFAVEAFRKLKQEFDTLMILHPGYEDMFCWSRIKTVPGSVSRIRNSSIGTLLTDLSEGADLDGAVGSFEAKVAPANYKRPTALVTKAMIEKAQAKIEELGFTSALERRYAVLSDITINNVLYADRTAKKAMNVFESLSSTVAEKVPNLDKVESVTIETFLANILPKAESLEVLFENRHTGNLVSLIAPVAPEAKTMFKWDNNFSWSYEGEVADSIKERVKRAGGSVEGDLCCRLAWEYTDDLDFWMEEPGKFKICFSNRRQKSPCGGELDLDANGADGPRQDPAENIFYARRRTMKEGLYVLKVNNYNRRSSGTGFEVEIEFDGQKHHIAYDKALRTGDIVEVATIQYSKLTGFKIVKSLPSSPATKTVWSVPTQTFHKVNVVMLSPNYWDDRTSGNKHYFFMLEGCLNEGRARGFFNEFLVPELDQNRKVLEMVGSKMKTEETTNQLSGLGFSSTQRNYILCRVKGAFSRTIKITF